MTKRCTDKIPNTRLGCMWDITATSWFQPPVFICSVWICKAKIIICHTDANRVDQVIGLLRLQVNYSTYESFISFITTFTWPPKFYGRLQGDYACVLARWDYFHILAVVLQKSSTFKSKLPRQCKVQVCMHRTHYSFLNVHLCVWQ